MNTAKKHLQEEFEKHKGAEDLQERLKMILHDNKVLYSRARRYLDYEIKEGMMTIIENQDEIAGKEKEFGKNIIFTNKLEADCSETISTYKEKMKVEDSFKTIKDHRIISFHPIWHWTDSKIRIDAFISVLAYLMIKLLQYLAREEGSQGDRLKVEVKSFVATSTGNNLQHKLVIFDSTSLLRGRIGYIPTN